MARSFHSELIGITPFSLQARSFGPRARACGASLAQQSFEVLADLVNDLITVAALFGRELLEGIVDLLVDDPPQGLAKGLTRPKLEGHGLPPG
jgi:hypothetical protein